MFLEERFGRHAILRYASDLVRAGNEATAAEQEAQFAACFGKELEICAAEWSQALSYGDDLR